MQAFQNIVIFHPAAIGDAMLATPVAKALRLNFPEAKISYWSHPALKEVLGCNPDIDRFLDFQKGTNILKLIQTLRNLKPDLLIDLSNSSRGAWLSYFGGAKAVRYRKRPVAERPIMHAVDNFLATVESICQRRPESFFPTVFPGQEVIESVKANMQVPNDTNRTLIGIVPGVGKLRPHRAWPPSHWIALLQRLDHGKYWPVLIGGADEVELCDKISDGLSGQCTNLAGQLSLLQTAACLTQCAFVISGDTGPAHVAVAVGTRVVGIYGPTFAQRSGPFGCSASTIDRSGQCYCIEAKNCIVVSPGQPSNCLSEIYVEEVEEKMGAVAQNRGNMVS